MKKIITATIFLLALSHCNDSGSEKARNKRMYKPGDRAGADTSMVDLEDAISPTDKICQRWDNKEDAEETFNSSGELELPSRGFYLFKDGSMVKDARDKMIFGTWSYDDKQKILEVTLANGSSEKYNVQKILYDQLLMSKMGEKKEPVEYIADGFVHKDLMNDPFYAPNMQWRVKPKTPEDNAALHKRIKDCLHFYYLYYIDNSKRNSAKITFYGLPGCFKWYEGGIHLMKEEKLDKRWTDIFYNAADASHAYIILDKMISKKYDWDTSGIGWVKQNAGVLKQMEKKIDSL